MASKEAMVSAPVVVLLFERTFLTHDLRKAWRKSWPLYAGLATTWILLVYLIADAPRQASAGFHLGVPLVNWWLTQANVVLLYLKLTFWPWPLFIYYDMGTVRSLGEAMPGLLVVGALGVGTLIALWPCWGVGFLGAWFFIILSPTSLIPIISEVAAERRMYLPLVSIAVLVVVGGFWLALTLARRARAEGRRAAGTLIGGTLLLAAGLAVALAAVSYHRLAAYQTEVALWQDSMARQPQSDLMRFCLAYALSNAGRHEEAAEYYAQAVRMNPRSPYFLYMSAKNLMELDRRSEAIALLQKALKLNSHFPEAHYDLGLILQKEGKNEGAAQHFTEAAQQQPGNAEFLAQYAHSLKTLGKLPESVAEFEKALICSPRVPRPTATTATHCDSPGGFPKRSANFDKRWSWTLTCVTHTLTWP